jgi:hypothetical protein
LRALIALPFGICSPRSISGRGLLILSSVLLGSFTARAQQVSRPQTSAVSTSSVPRFRDWSGPGIGAYQHSEWGSTRRQAGFELAVGESFRSTGTLFFGGRGSFRLQFAPGDGIALSRQGDLLAGLRAGPVLVQSEVGAALITLDRLDGNWSMGLMSPRVGLGAGFVVDGDFYLGASAYSEYAWRWFGHDQRQLGITVYFNRVRAPASK